MCGWRHARFLTQPHVCVDGKGYLSLVSLGSERQTGYPVYDDGRDAM